MAPPAKRRKTQQLTELTFDPAARQEYLSGFHKRKVQRAKHAKEAAQRREREEKIQERKELREQRKTDLEKHVSEVNAALRAQDEALESDGEPDRQSGTGAVVDEEWVGFEEPIPVDALDEYVDEDKYTTVTVKELDDVRDFESGSEAEDGDAGAATRHAHTDADSKGRQPKKAGGPKPKKKKRNFRYETKLERQAERKKQKLKKTAAAKARRGDEADKPKRR